MDLKALVASLTEPERQAALQHFIRERARCDLIAFCQYVDPMVAHLYGAAHLRKLAAALERVDQGECKRLFITTAPRHWKSSLVSEKFAAYWLARHQRKSVIGCSGAEHLALSFSSNVKGTIQSDLFRELFPKIQLYTKRQADQEWALLYAYRASYRAIGVNSMITGRGGDLIIIDDPVADEKEAFNPTQREATWQYYQNSLRDRLEPGGAMVLIMSRWHADDLAGRLLRLSESGDGEKWEVLHLPAFNEKEEALWPERISADELRQTKLAIGTRAFAAKFMGNPKPEEGSILDSRKLKWKSAAEIPTYWKRIVRRWDLAFSDKNGADYLSGAKIGLDQEDRRWILHIKRVHGRWTHGKPVIVQIAREDGPDVEVLIEGNGTQLGYYQEIKEDEKMQDRVVTLDQPEGSKEMRASMWGTRLEDGIICCLANQPWVPEFIDQMDYFPNWEHDDDIDAVSGGMMAVAGGTHKVQHESVDTKTRPSELSGVRQHRGLLY